jgi:hypothetical protein
MEAHFQNGIEIEPVTVDSFYDNLNINDQRLVLASALLNQIAKIQKDKVAFFCMRKVSLYDTYEEALSVKNEAHLFDSTIYIPQGYTSNF